MTRLGYRIFISYSREDAGFARTVVDALEELKHLPDIDINIQPGTPFSDSIRAMIARAHIFIPVMSKDSELRPWVHQETGYAIALRVPVLPIGYGVDPEAMIRTLHSIEIPEECDSDAKRKSWLVKELGGGLLDRVAQPNPPIPERPFEIADWEEERAERLARYTAEVLRLEGSQPLRQLGALSSFCLPLSHHSSGIWKARDGKAIRSPYYHNLQRRERLAFEAYARTHGCRLIVTPRINLERRGRGVTAVRLYTLREFLKSCQDESKKVEIVEATTADRNNLTIVGDWFRAEARASKSAGYRQTVFEWHGPTVLQAIDEFDRLFSQILEGSPTPKGKSTREAMIDSLDAHIQRWCDELKIENVLKLIPDVRGENDSP